ncbi:MAG: hemolysin hemolytic protein [Bacteroidaceae bacterium]|nr:hemolysin hemolytic protein [Bacteroidaceae bacterium]
MYNIPILIVIFNRKEIAIRTFESIRRVQPSKLYIAGDGPRPEVDGEDILVQETRRAILDRIDWDCQVQTLFQSVNLGCGPGMYTAIDWLFKNEERGIIIEDDCVLQHSFYQFAEELLERYKDDTRIGLIDAANYQAEIPVPDSYGFSRYKSTNGWASWRRAWKLMDLDMNWRNSDYAESIIANMGYRSKDISYWRYRLKAIDNNVVSAWDWQWYFTLAAHNMLGIYPSCSLQTNIGFGEAATHTTDLFVPKYYETHSEIEFPLHHPKYVVPFEPFEHRSYNRKNTLYTNLIKYIPFSVKKFLKTIIR